MNFTEMQKPIYEAWFRDIASRLNFYLKKYKVPLTVKPPQEITLEELNAFITSGGPPEIFDNEIESAILMLVKTTDTKNGLFVQNKSNFYSAVNATQGGKNGSCVLFIILKRLWCHLHGMDCEFLYVCPGDTTIEEMTLDTYWKIVRFLQIMEFQNSVNAGKYASLINDNKESRPHIWSMTSKASLRRDIMDRMDVLTSQGKILVTIWDEAHIAENKKSISDCIFGEEIRQKFARRNHQIIFVSATPYTYHWSKYVDPIYLKLGKTYTGFNCNNGHEVDPDVPIVTPHILSFDSFQKEPIPLYPKAGWSSKALTRIGDAYGIDWSKFGVTDCNSYFNVMMERIFNIFRHYVNNGVKGFCARFINNDDHTREIVERLQTEFKKEKLVVIKYTQEMGYKELREQIAHCAQNKWMFIIVVTAKGRCSNRFPKDVEVFMDFTWSYSTAASMVQGFPGRSSIYGNPRTLLLSAANYNLLLAYVGSKGRINTLKIKPHLRAVCNKTAERKNFSFSHKDERAAVLFKNASLVLGKIVKQQATEIQEHKRSGGKYGRSRPRGQWIPFEKIFPQFVMQALEKKYGFKLLRLNQIPTYYVDLAKKNGEISYKYHNFKPKHHGSKEWIKTDEVFIAFRSNDSNGLRSARSDKQSNSMKQSEGKRRGIEPHISFDVNTGQITHIDLALAEPFKYNVGANPEAQEASIFDHHFERPNNA